MVNFEEIRKEVAIEHNVLIGKDDPLLIIQTINEAVLQKALEMQQEKHTEFLEALKTAQKQGLAEAKLSAGRMITDSASYVSEQIREEIKTAMGAELVRFQAVRQEAKIEVDSEIHRWMRAAVGGLVIGILVFGIMVWGMLTTSA